LRIKLELIKELYYDARPNRPQDMYALCLPITKEDIIWRNSVQ